MRHRLGLWLLVTVFGFCAYQDLAVSETYNLRAVKGIQAFSGSAEAKKLLGQNGFVVADPAFKQIFEPYIKSPQTEEPSESNRMEKTQSVGTPGLTLEAMSRQSVASPTNSLPRLPWLFRCRAEPVNSM